MGTDLYPYLRKDLLDLVLQTPGVLGYTNFTHTHSSYYEVKFYDKYLYITFTSTGLYIVIEAPECRKIPSKSIYHENHFKFQPIDKIWLRDSLDSELLGNKTVILDMVDEPAFKNKYGYCFYDLAARFQAGK